MQGHVHNVQMISFISKERSNTSGSTWRVVIGEFSELKVFRPVILLIVAIDSKVLF